MANLSRCICGGKAEIALVDKRDAQFWYTCKYVYCTSCGLQTQPTASDGYYDLYFSDEEASDLWNRIIGVHHG